MVHVQEHGLRISGIDRIALPYEVVDIHIVHPGNERHGRHLLLRRSTIGEISRYLCREGMQRYILALYDPFFVDPVRIDVFHRAIVHIRVSFPRRKSPKRSPS